MLLDGKNIIHTRKILFIGLFKSLNCIYPKPRFEGVLLHNEIVDIFSDQYTQLGEEEITNMEQGAHTHLQQYQSFTDLKHSKDKSISCIDWHPTQKGNAKVLK
jgi:hypothetical protein